MTETTPDPMATHQAVDEWTGDRLADSGCSPRSQTV